MKFKEIELKYRADDISLSDFHDFCWKSPKSKYIEASGFDHFYANESEPDAFCRLRVGVDVFQLTYKKKTVDANNFIRDEDNIDLAKSMTRAKVESFLSKIGYTYNTSVFKSCFIYKHDWYTYVYYVCYDIEMKETGRFIEIEMSEEHDWASESEAWNQLVVLEKLAKSLGLTPQSRTKKSLFELYRKDPK